MPSSSSDVTKNKEARVVVLNDVAQRIVDELRGQHPTYVLTWEDRKGRRQRFCRLNNSGWKAARRRAAARYQQELGRQALPATCRASVARYGPPREKRSVRGEPAGYELREEPHALRLACLPLCEKPERSVDVQVGARHPHQ